LTRTGKGRRRSSHLSPGQRGQRRTDHFQGHARSIDLDALLEQITLDSTGAAAVFTGMVRGVTTRGEAHQTVALEYEAYVPMAEAKMAQVAIEIARNGRPSRALPSSSGSGIWCRERRPC